MALSMAQPTGSNAALPAIDPANFTTNIDNPFLTLRPGTTFVYNDLAEKALDTVTVTRDTVVIMGVTCVVVHDVATVNGQVIEDTFDWVAQDNLGNVWYFGEATAQFEPGNPVPFSTEGSWKAGFDGAQPGILMEADPQVGDLYNEEDAPGVAVDEARVVSHNAHVDVAYGSFDDVLKTRNFSAIIPGDIEHKFYVEGIGFVLGTDAEGQREEQLIQIKVDGLAGNDRLVGYGGGDDMRGFAGNDRMFGLDGNDKMSGGIGNDQLKGNAGGDTLDGGSGNDRLNGGGGADRFVFHNLQNGFAETDTIADYHKGQVDVIDLPDRLHSIASDDFVNGAWQLTLAGDGDVIVLGGVIDANNNGHITDDLLIA